MTRKAVAQAPFATAIGLGGIGVAALLAGAAAIAAPLPASLIVATILAAGRLRR